MAPALKLVFDFIIWILVPTLFGMALWETYSQANLTENTKTGESSRSGFWAGFILFLIVLVYQVGEFFKTKFPQENLFKGFDIWLAFSGAILAFLLFSGGRKIIPTHLKGWSVFIASFCIFYASAHYFLIRTYNEFLLSVTLGAALGVLLHRIINPVISREMPKIH